MELVFKTELERIKLSDNSTEDLQLRNLTEHIDKFEYVFEMLGGKGREQYMQRC